MKHNLLHDRKLRERAAEYEEYGYSVILYPEPHVLPSFLHRFRPDMLVMSPESNVVVCIADNRKPAEDFAELAEAVGKEPGWRFERLYANPPAAPDVPAAAEVADEEQVRSFLARAEKLAAEGDTGAAALLAWSALEVILRRWADANDLIDVLYASSVGVLKLGYAIGRFEDETYSRLQRLLEYRNAVAHGFRADVDPSTLAEAIDEIRRLETAA